MRHSRTAALSAALLAAAAVTFAAPAPARAGDDWRSQPYDHDGLNINAKSIEWKKGKLWLKLQVVNTSEGTMVFNPDAIQAKLPTGALATRERGVFDKMSAAHAAKTMAPGGGEEVAIEYVVGDVRRVGLQFFGVTIDGKPHKFPEWVTTSGVTWTGAPYPKSSNILFTVLGVSTSKSGVEVKIKVDNHNDAPLYIDKTLFKAKLPTGDTVNREKTLMKNQITILGHEADDFSLEFKVGDPTSFSLVMDGINNGVLNLPDWPFTRQ